MTILKIDGNRILAVPAECHAPWPIHVPEISRRLATQLLKAEPGQVHILRRHSGIQSIQLASHALNQAGDIFDAARNDQKAFNAWLRSDQTTNVRKVTH